MSDSNTVGVDARPVKEFFISIITRDIKLIDTIPEFVDNSIDEATRSADSESLDGFYLDVLSMKCELSNPYISGVWRPGGLMWT